jgi:hypothetical protein
MTLTRTIDFSALAAISLLEGSHTSAEDGMCVMEAVAYVAGEPFSDHPRASRRSSPRSAARSTID